MPRPRNVFFYTAVVLLLGAGIYGILAFGSQMETASAAPAVTAPAKPPAPAAEGVAESPASLLLLQIIVIVAAAKGLGALVLRIGQPPVIGEMIAGILLGPSLLGMLAPAAHSFLFPASSLGTLQLLSQIGVILFMFVVGMELDLESLHRNSSSAVLVSHTSIAVSFFLGTAMALLLHPTLAPSGLRFSAFGLFVGVSMSITAFPVLARILEERRLSRTPLGNTAITCAAVDDVTAWCLLAVVIALVKADGLGGALLTIFLSFLLIVGMLFLVRPRAGRLLGGRSASAVGGTGFLAAILVFVLASALTAEVIGIHALFGAFLAGVCIPRGAGLREQLRHRLEALSSVLLLPLFFAVTGLRTQVGLLDGWRNWLICAGIIAVAIAGKLGGTLIAARWTGMGWSDSFSLGTLMNTRGLVELIVLNLGYDLGVLSPRIFAMLVLMALITTFMTGPLLSLINWLRERPLQAAVQGSANL